MKNWKVELKTGGKNLSWVKMQRGKSLGDVLSPQLFVIVMMSFNHMDRKCKGRYKLRKKKNQLLKVRTHQTVDQKMKENWKPEYSQ